MAFLKSTLLGIISEAWGMECKRIISNWRLETGQCLQQCVKLGNKGAGERVDFVHIGAGGNRGLGATQNKSGASHKGSAMSGVNERAVENTAALENHLADLDPFFPSTIIIWWG